MRKLFILLFFLPLLTLAQKKQIALEDIYKNRIFQGEQVRADFVQVSKDPEIKTDSLKDETGKPFGQADDMIFSETYPNIVLLKRGNEQIYRRSSKAFVYLYEANTKKLTKLAKEKIPYTGFVSFSITIAAVVSGAITKQLIKNMAWALWMQISLT